jgi:hypothetical protein
MPLRSALRPIGLPILAHGRAYCQNLRRRKVVGQFPGAVLAGRLNFLASKRRQGVP